MPRHAWNKSPLEIKRTYFELIRQGLSGSSASSRVGVSLSCGSLWFIDAGSVSMQERPVNRRYLNQDDRIEIAEGLRAGEPVKAIAARIGKTYQSVYREIARNRKPDGRYQPWFAHNQAYLRRQRPKASRVTRDAELRRVIADKLGKRWSPGQISRWLRRRWPHRRAWHLCPESIYQAVYLGHIAVLSPPLRTGRTYRHKRGRGRTREGALKQCAGIKSIHQRPAVVEERTQVGHWEGDLLVGAFQRSAIATLVDRKSRHTLLVPIRGTHSAVNVGDALIDVFRAWPAALRRTLTWDQGNEMFHFDRVESMTGLRIFFADAHSPWQRGTNENTNGLLRQYFPKGTDFTNVTDGRLREVALELNERPRLCLGDRSPLQVMSRWVSHLAPT